ncbi:F-box/FBD/LRR-repeat protein [Citrus sinensis]|uniref:F-box/FBD/LRR-repeat protein At5g22700-like n=1 Tax=Citrus sinensis TaxID=2711 RepID=UPI0021A1F664|nr:F-box/FBD/LRR-repeat protein At5g22700-like [Citrus sinensis]KAH9726565.1 F-box/FBD/LRR-repeat protein [Citrus sinensis]
MNKSKSRKVGKLNKRDRISRMPDSILCHILSFLPTEPAVQTSILSSRWKLVWTSLPNLVFDDKFCYRSGGTSVNNWLTRFENFVNRMLLSNSVNINKFSLHCRKLRYLSCLKFWVALAIMRNVREIEVYLPFGNPFEEGYKPAELPDCIYNSETLEILKLETDFLYKSPSSGICFPRVKKFHVEIHKPNMPDFSICPVLEDLSIVAYLLTNDWKANISISSQTIKRLNLLIERYMGFSNEHQVMIEAPKLEHLFIKDHTLVSYLVHELHSLCDAHIEINYSGERDHPSQADRALQLLKKLSNLQSLYLCDGTIYALGEAYQYLYDARQYFLPTFSNLSFLEVRTREYGGWILPIIFSCSPNLETFVWMMATDDPEDDVEVEWIEPQFVPYCLQFNVKKIEILYHDDDPLEPVKYLLKNCGVLDRMIFRYVGESSNELCKELLMFPRGSKTCEVEFRGKYRD